YYHNHNNVKANGGRRPGRPGRPAGQRKQEQRLGRSRSNNNNNSSSSTSKKQIYKENYYRKNTDNNNNTHHTTTNNNNDNNIQRPTGKRKGIDENDVSARDRAGQTNLHRAC